MISPQQARDRILSLKDTQEGSADDFVKSIWYSRRRSFKLPSGVAQDAPVEVQVNAFPFMYATNICSRWIVTCPDCGGGEEVDLKARLFFCCSCYNESAGGRWRPIQIPAERENIERVLLARQDSRMRNWLPHESVDDLLVQNVTLGDPIPNGLTAPRRRRNR